jgi:hypothetical protein
MDAELLLSLVMGGFVGFGLLGSLAGAARRGAAHQRRLEGVWRGMANHFQVPLRVDGRGALTPLRLGFVVERSGAAVDVLAQVPSDAESPGHTRLVSVFVLGAGPSFRAIRRGPLTGLDRALGVTEVPTGDAAFDGRWSILGDQVEATRALWDAEARRLLDALRVDVDLRSDGQGLHLTLPRVEESPRILEQALGLLVHLASFGVADLESLADLSGARYEAPTGGLESRTPPRVRVRRGEADVTLEAHPSPEGPRHLARAPARPRLPAFSIEVEEDGTVLGEVPEGLVDPQVEAALARLGHATVTREEGGEEVEVRWFRPPDTQRAEAGVVLLSRMARGAGRRGAFR